MNHIAIMKKSLGYTEKIANGQKTIESRWYKSKRTPWNRILVGDIVYFKNSGEPVALVAVVENVLQFQNLTKLDIQNILNMYSSMLGIDPSKVDEFHDSVKDARYCILIFLKNVKPTEPFIINKNGFGLMSAWLTTPDIQNITLS